TNSSVNKKVLAALEHGLRPLVCVGETAAQRDYSVAEEVVACQVKIALHGVEADQLSDVFIAYEPGWAIGEKGTHASPSHVSAIHRQIRETIGSRGGKAIAEQVRVLYGGSVTKKNAAAFAGQPEVDGLFIGRAALDVASFIEIIRTFCAARFTRPALAQAGNGADTAA
ncbi:MAG: triose-phosphate isomerase, partial [Gaiellaceae bacterium]